VPASVSTLSPTYFRPQVASSFSNFQTVIRPPL